MLTGRTNTLTIRTPEGVVFSLLLAGPIPRFLAWIVDLMVISVITQLLGQLLQLIFLVSPDIARAAWILLYFVISIGYGITLEWVWRGRTLGKRLLRLRVMDEQALRLTFSQVVIRNLLRFIDSLPWFYLVGGIACLVSKKAQRLGDFAANTIVVRNPQTAAPNLEQLLEDKYNSFHNYPHLEARLRQRTSTQEAGVALQALIRRDELDPEARIELFRDIAAHFSQHVDFPSEAVEGLSDEKITRNIVSALFRS